MKKENVGHTQNHYSLVCILILLCVATSGTIIVVLLGESYSYRENYLSIPRRSDLSWRPGGSIVCNATGNQYNPEIVSDDANGAILCWRDERPGVSGIYTQRIVDGSPQWATNGVELLTGGTLEGNYYMTKDSEGGAIISWIDYRNPPNCTVYASRVDENGVLQWGANGSQVTLDTSMAYEVKSILTSDNNTVFIWSSLDEINERSVIHASKVDNSFSFLFSDKIVGFYNDSESIEVCSDGLGGVILTYGVYIGSYREVIAQRIDTSGSLLWGSGVQVSETAYNQFNARIAPDGIGGAYSIWIDDEYGLLSRVYRQHINSSGHVQWGEKGYACTSSYSWWDLNLVTDNDGGALALFNTYDIVYLQRFNDTGEIWTTVIVNNDNTHNIPELVPDGHGGAIIAWRENRLLYGIYAQRVDAKGLELWGENGTAIVDGNTWVVFPEICVDNDGNGLFTWSSGDSDIYCAFLKEEYIPSSNHPDDIITDVYHSETIIWTLTHTRPGGGYRVYNTTMKSNVYQEGGPWSSGAEIEVPILRNSPGIYQYIIEFWDQGSGINSTDAVLVTVRDLQPYTNIPPNITLRMNEYDVITWKIYDDFGGGSYRVIMENVLLDIENEIVTWRSWNNGSDIEVPIYSSIPGEFTCTIEFNTTTGQMGSQTVYIIYEDKYPIQVRDILVYVILGVVSTVAAATLVMLIRLQKKFQKIQKDFGDLNGTHR
jgi:hypothetical protein